MKYESIQKALQSLRECIGDTQYDAIDISEARKKESSDISDLSVYDLLKK